MDFPASLYETVLQTTAGTHYVEHKLTGAESLRRLIAEGFAEYMVEARDARTMHSSVACSGSATSTEVAPLAASVSPHLKLYPRVVITKGCCLPLDDLASVWGNVHPHGVPMRAGQFVAAARHLTVKPAVSSLVIFEEDPGLSSGAVRLRESTASGDIQYVCSYDPHLGSISDHANTAVSIFAVALMRLAADEHYRIDHETGLVPDSPTATELYHMLRQRDIPDWSDLDEWDPMFAATTLTQGFVPTVDEGDQL